MDMEDASLVAEQKGNWRGRRGRAGKRGKGGQDGQDGKQEVQAIACARTLRRDKCRIPAGLQAVSHPPVCHPHSAIPCRRVAGADREAFK
ncbi:MAG: hypothetical protein II543_00650, partial [Desulfovibrio sp.]|nr:hypothetical protein [Desulfovibrio sp.]